MSDIIEIQAQQYFEDLKKDGREDNENNLRSWLGFTCPADYREDVEDEIQRLRHEKAHAKAVKGFVDRLQAATCLTDLQEIMTELDASRLLAAMDQQGEYESILIGLPTFGGSEISEPGINAWDETHVLTHKGGQWVIEQRSGPWRPCQCGQGIDAIGCTCYQDAPICPYCHAEMSRDDLYEEKDYMRVCERCDGEVVVHPHIVMEYSSRRNE